jgi:hypothetical protein
MVGGSTNGNGTAIFTGAAGMVNAPVVGALAVAGAMLMMV